MTKRQFIRVAQPYNALKAVIEVFRKATELRQSERTRSGNRQSGDSIALIIETVAKLQSDARFRTGSLSRRKFEYVKQKWDSAGPQNPTPACSERLPFTGSGNEPGVDWCSTEETYQNTLVVDAVDNRRTDSIRIIHRPEGSGFLSVYESVRVARGVGVSPDHQPFVIQTQGLCSSGGRKIEDAKLPTNQKESVIHPVGINEESADPFGIVDPGRLCRGRTGNVEQFKNATELIIDVSMIGASAVCLCAVVSGSLAEVVLAKQLIEGRAGIVDFQETTPEIRETVGLSVIVDVEARSFVIVVDADDLGLGRVREVFVSKGARPGSRESLIDSCPVVARDGVGIVDAERLGKCIAGVFNGFESVGRRPILSIHGHADKNSQTESENQWVDSFHLFFSPVI